MRKELYDIMKEEGLAHLTFTDQQIRERVAKAKIVKAIRFHVKRIRERKLYQAHVMRIQRVFRGYRQRVMRVVQAFKIDKYGKIMFLKEQRRLFFTLLEKTVKDKGMDFELGKYAEMVKQVEEFDTLRY